MKIKITLIATFMAFCSINAFGQFGPHDQIEWSRFTPLTQQEIMAPALMMRQRADNNAAFLNSIINDLVEFRRGVSDRQYLEFLNVEIQGLRNLFNTDLARADNVIRQRISRIQDGIDRHERRIRKESFINQGRLELQNGFPELAITQFRRALEIDPNCAWTHNLIGITFHNLENFDMAIRYYQRAITLGTDYHYPMWNIAIVYGILGNRERQISFNTRAARLGNESAQAWLRSNNLTW